MVFVGPIKVVTFVCLFTLAAECPIPGPECNKVLLLAHPIGIAPVGMNKVKCPHMAQAELTCVVHTT